MENWIERIRLTECLMVASIVVAFLILAVFGQRKTWISTESIMAVISGLAFVIFPRQILTLEASSHMHIIRHPSGIRLAQPYLSITLMTLVNIRFNTRLRKLMKHSQKLGHVG